jgi:hypothetical protein
MELPRPHELPEEVSKLGELRAVFRGKRGLVVFCWVLAALASLLALGALAIFIIGLVKLRVWNGRLLVSLAIGLFWAAARFFRKAYQSRALRVFVCADGLARALGPAIEVLRWDDVRVIKRDREVKNNWLISPARLVVAGGGGQELVFNEAVSGLGELRRLTEEHKLPLMLPPTITAFAGGTILNFGAVSVSREDLHCGEDTLPWDLFERAEVAKGLLYLYGGGANDFFGRVDVARVPNVHVLLALMEYARGRRWS